MYTKQGTIVGGDRIDTRYKKLSINTIKA